MAEAAEPPSPWSLYRNPHDQREPLCLWKSGHQISLTWLSKHSSCGSGWFLSVTVVLLFVLRLPEAGDSVLHPSGSPGMSSDTDEGTFLLTECLLTYHWFLHKSVNTRSHDCVLNRNGVVPLSDYTTMLSLVKRFMAASLFWNMATKQ